MREMANQFQVEVDICTQYRLGRMEESNYRIEAGNSRIETSLAKLLSGKLGISLRRNDRTS